MSALHFSKDHEWIKVDGDIATVGITNHAQEQLGDVVFVELPEPGKSLSKGDEAAVVESVKAASEVYAPISGEVVEVNAAIASEPGKVNADAEGTAWFVKIRIKDKSELDGLLDRAGYDAFVAEQG